MSLTAGRHTQSNGAFGTRQKVNTPQKPEKRKSCGYSIHLHTMYYLYLFKVKSEHKLNAIALEAFNDN
jgi:hypothetical protein